jgi:D-serine dehydratase
MSETLRRVQALVLSGDYLVSDHGFYELEEDAIVGGDAIAGIAGAISIEDYPDRARGPSVLALQHDSDGHAIHVVWAIPAGQRRPAVLVTAYRPNQELWDTEFRERR